MMATAKRAAKSRITAKDAKIAKVAVQKSSLLSSFLASLALFAVQNSLTMEKFS